MVSTVHILASVAKTSRVPPIISRQFASAWSKMFDKIVISSVSRRATSVWLIALNGNTTRGKSNPQAFFQWWRLLPILAARFLMQMAFIMALVLFSTRLMRDG